eukprot:9489069-Pyramimonas_sp.AAC.1
MSGRCIGSMAMLPIFGGVDATLLTKSHGPSTGTIMNMARGHLRIGASSSERSAPDKIHHHGRASELMRTGPWRSNRPLQ